MTERNSPTEEKVWPRRVVLLGVPRTKFAWLVDLRELVIVSILIVLAIFFSAYALTLGSLNFSLVDVVEAFTGQSTESTQRIIIDWRMPRVLVALVAGAALGVSGAIFQSLTRNPLGSPDVIGLGAGAYTGALVAGLVIGAGTWGTTMGALAGGLLAGIVIFILAWGRSISGPTFIVIGIGVSAALTSINNYLLITVEIDRSMSAAAWGVGSLADVKSEEAFILLGIVAVGIPIAAVLGQQLRVLEIGDDSAMSLGVRVGRARFVLFAIGVLLVSCTTAFTGPIAFVALAAPQLARLLIRSPQVGILSSAAMGAALLAGSDLAARTVFGSTPVPVGIVTLCVGGTYLCYLLLSRSRRTV